MLSSWTCKALTSERTVTGVDARGDGTADTGDVCAAMGVGADAACSAAETAGAAKWMAARGVAA